MESNLQIPFEGARHYSEEYKLYVFRFWYNNSKQGARWVHKNLPLLVDHISGKEVTEAVISNWILNDFNEFAVSLDAEVGKALDASLIKERVEMLMRHTSLSLEMQKMAMDYLHSNEAVLDTRTALQMLVKGIEIERESRGLPIDELLKYKDQTDRELVETLREIVTEGKILDITPNDNPAG